ncbi:hypothetical protein ABER99_20605 [Paenibacillus glucanolyticus]|jgi:hypothetical protein|uniref:Uncharacterized protein n=1 Tax=Paenibacillus glucanolyticus TaxID=59843 RepID=A0A168EWJ9_9BACL|nr:hypothetical protein [Paenibacillus glucanolyticus]KZS44895.1 hypothetical protein AWU65_02615 [Paenibacillus glucanolyticus]OMF65557.1 hypothetical protein BK142_30570 [Paenibacillus glucanolyticus]
MNETCRKCGHFDPLVEVCGINLSVENDVTHCKGFNRYINLLNEYTEQTGKFHTVATKRGLERAIPAYSDLNLEDVSNNDGSVESIFTFQGQRELIFNYGVNIATQIATENSIHLNVLQYETNSLGSPEKIREYFDDKQRFKNSKEHYWMSDTPIEVW